MLIKRKGRIGIEDVRRVRWRTSTSRSSSAHSALSEHCGTTTTSAFSEAFLAASQEAVPRAPNGAATRRRRAGALTRKRWAGQGGSTARPRSRCGSESGRPAGASDTAPPRAREGRGRRQRDRQERSRAGVRAGLCAGRPPWPARERMRRACAAGTRTAMRARRGHGVGGGD